MRDLHELDEYRLTDPDTIAYYGGPGDETCGAFQINSPVDGTPMIIVASSDGGWDHVSVSKRRRVPNYVEMKFIKRLFFQADETAMELHVPESDHISFHPNCLHLWRPNDGREIPLPPNIFVGLKIAN